MDARHAEYVEYYRARMARYEGNPMYPASYAAERALFDAIHTASSLDEFGERLRAGKLDLACAVARVRDQETAQAAFYRSIEEPVRAAPHEEVLARLDQTRFDNVVDLNSMVSEVHVKWQLEIIRDESLRDQFWNDWKILEDIEEDEQAVLSERWRGEAEASRQRAIESGQTHFREHTLPELRKFIPDYQPDYDALWQPRHRRRFPLADDIVTERIAGHKRYWGLS